MAISKRVFNDAGHGGHDPGAVDGKKNDALYTVEEDIALDLALRYGRAIERCGLTVRNSRTTDTYPTLQTRAAAANAWPAGIFVSWHCNAHYDGSAARGIEVLHWPNSATGIALAKAVYEAMDDVSPWADRGLKARSDLYVIRATTMPAIIIESGFITNTEEEKLLNSSSYRLALAEAAAKGTCKFYGIPYVPAVATAPAPKPPAPAPAPAWKVSAQTADTITLRKG